ncbi:FAD-dependent monooxygenase [Streptomyces nondiastaticus]|uniref:FAD-dependent monooxygenase n=1 Tax=Streptomyces nondiastaticus TaxID=3154512 RepID=UPI00343A6BB5
MEAPARAECIAVGRADARSGGMAGCVQAAGHPCARRGVDLGGTPVPTGPIVDKRLVPLRSVVYSPMSYGRLYLLGDAAHIVPPMSAIGTNLALHDTGVFAHAVIRRIRESDSALLDEFIAA